jgi:hypothetical protein
MRVPVDLRRADFNIFNARRRFRNRLAILSQPVDMKFNCFFNESQDFVSGLRDCNAPGQIGNVSAKTGFTFFYDDGIAHISYSLSFFNPACFKILLSVPEAHQYSVSRNSDSSGLVSVLELAMAALCSYQIPSMLFKKLEDLLDLHSQIIEELFTVGKTQEPWSSQPRS